MLQGGDLSTGETGRLLQLSLPSYGSLPGSQPEALRKAQEALHSQLTASAHAAVAAAEGDANRTSARLYAAAALSAVVEPFTSNVRHFPLLFSFTFLWVQTRLQLP